MWHRSELYQIELQWWKCCNDHSKPNSLCNIQNCKNWVQKQTSNVLFIKSCPNCLQN
jgi:hypothetical protein